MALGIEQCFAISFVEWNIAGDLYQRMYGSNLYPCIAYFPGSVPSGLGTYGGPEGTQWNITIASETRSTVALLKWE